MLQVIDCHAEGEPARVVVGGLPHVPGANMVEKREAFMRDFDDYRKLLLHEPRGYPCQNADFIVPSTRPDAAFGVVIAEQAAMEDVHGRVVVVSGDATPSQLGCVDWTNKVGVGGHRSKTSGPAWRPTSGRR